MFTMSALSSTPLGDMDELLLKDLSAARGAGAKLKEGVSQLSKAVACMAQANALQWSPSTGR